MARISATAIWMRFCVMVRLRAIAQASGAWADEEVPVIGMRRRIAQNMAAAKRHIPHFTYVEEVEVTALEEMRGQLNSAGGRPQAPDPAAAPHHRPVPRAAASPDAQRAL
jgi:pyruvate/2-oxoglutarate dehydrogenase complex dihydrolipoamide acyltransferase (E2) component